MNIVIHANGGSAIGMGHIMRTLALAKVLSVNNEVFYVCKESKNDLLKYKAGIDKIKEEGFKIVEISEENFKQEIKRIKADCLITDSYDVDEDYFNIVKNHFKLSGCIDDVVICDYFNVDFIINPNIYAKDLIYKTNGNTKLLLGSDYVILRDEFRKIHNSERIISREINKVMLTVGGSDNNNLSEKIIKQLSNCDFELNVVVGAGFKYINEIKKYEGDKVRLCFNCNMLDLMLKSDVAISSCGTTLYELAICGTPTIGIVVADNQILAAECMEKLGLICCSDIENIYDNISKLTYGERGNLSINAKKIVDGLGVERISEMILKL